MTLPSSIPGLAGPVLVRWHPLLPNTEAGGWNARQRIITLSADLSKPVQEQVFWHEWVHSVLDDADIRLRNDKEELVCSNLALGMLCLRRAKWISFRRLSQESD